MRSVVVKTFILSLMLASASVAQADAGKIAAASGLVQVKRADGSATMLPKGAAVQPGDTIFTGAADALIVLADGQKMYLKPNTEFKLEDYRFDNTAPEQGVSFLKLVKGGVRTISGLIGKKQPASYRLEAAGATIGIRGTDYSAVLCEQGACDGAADGLHVRVYEGAVSVSNQAATELVQAGLGAVVADSNAQFKASKDAGVVGISDSLLKSALSGC